MVVDLRHSQLLDAAGRKVLPAYGRHCTIIDGIFLRASVAPSAKLKWSASFIIVIIICPRPPELPSPYEVSEIDPSTGIRWMAYLLRDC